MSHFQPAPKPTNPLGYPRLISPSAGLRVSPLCLGAMNFGNNWSDFMGECTKEQAFGLMDAYYEMGGNFIDTANTYQDEQSETWVGEWLEKRGVRDQMVIATKYTSGFRQHAMGSELQYNFGGNSAISLHHSVNASLKKLRTDYIDLLYLHIWDFTTPIEEVMQSLNDLVARGKVLYLGISDTPAWVVSQANQYARDHGLRPFVVYQGFWSASMRDMEREIIPMCRSQGMGICPWGTLSRGQLRSEPERESRKAKPEGRDFAKRPPTEADISVSKVLEDIAKTKGKSVQAIALAWVYHKTPYVFPIVGGRKVEHLRSNVDAITISLSEEEMKAISDASLFDPGFPMNFIFGGSWKLDFTASDVFPTKWTAHIDSVPPAKPIPPRHQTSR
ncbi:norsolorinic acid reductase [Hypoxylon sp. FL1284]|nr:norsolorinic acid reductase [Hypoxylon sp. FL1284]